MNWADFAYTSSGGVISCPALYSRWSSEYVIYFLQSPCLLKVKKRNSNEARVEIECVMPLVSYAFSYSFERDGEVIADIRDILRAGFERRQNFNFTFWNNSCSIYIRLFDAAGERLGETELYSDVYDCPGLVPDDNASALVAPILPDLFVCPAASESAGLHNYAKVAARMLGSYTHLRLFSEDWTQLAEWNSNPFSLRMGDGVAGGGRIPNNAAWVVAADEHDTENIVVRVERTPAGCPEYMLLTWWGVLSGGYKSRMARIRRQGDRMGDTWNIVRGFEPTAAHAGVEVLDAVFENLSVNDYNYFKDILYSDEVLLNVSLYETWRRLPVRVVGNFMQTVSAQSVNFNLQIEIGEINTL